MATITITTYSGKDKETSRSIALEQSVPSSVEEWTAYFEGSKKRVAAMLLAAYTIAFQSKVRGLLKREERINDADIKKAMLSWKWTAKGPRKSPVDKVLTMAKKASLEDTQAMIEALKVSIASDKTEKK